LTLTVLLATSCKIERPGTDGVDPNYDGPGSEAWGSEDVTCDSGGDCLSSEACIDNVCQVPRCTGSDYESSPPIGQRVQLYAEAELGVVDSDAWSGTYYVDGYNPNGSTLSYNNSWVRGDSTPLGIAGGRFTSADKESYAIIEQGSGAIGLLQDGSPDWLTIEFYPVALDGGDVDGDGMDEAVAVSEDGRIAMCRLDKNQCSYAEFPDPSVVQVLDVAVGDVDGDTYDEIVLSMEYDGNPLIYAFNVDHENTDQVNNYNDFIGDRTLHGITTADLDGDNVEEIVTLEDGGWWDYSDDIVVVYNTQVEQGTPSDTESTGTLVEQYSQAVSGHDELIDIAGGDTDADMKDDIAVLDENREVIFLRDASGSLAERFTQTLSGTNAPKRIAFADHDGNSPVTTLKEGPVTCDGNLIPLMLLLPPPYDKTYSDGPSAAMYGDNTQQLESFSDTVSLGLNMDIGFGVDFMEIFGAKVNSRVSWHVSQKHTDTFHRFVGARYSIEAQPEIYGPNHGAVTLGWGCFDAYVYEVDDPDEILGAGADGQEFVMTVPVDGAVTLWSTNRYNAMAEALGTLPVIDIPYTLGEPETYPTAPEDLLGNPLSSDNTLFPDEQWYTVSDAGDVSFWRSVTQRESNSWDMSTDVGVFASGTAAGVTVGVGTSVGWGNGYSITLGSGAMFTGRIPSIPDDPNTPEDEWAHNRYSVNPIIYMQDYTDAAGEEASFYVQTYTVAH